MGNKEKKSSMKIVPPGKKKCVWMEAGVVSYKLCDNNYDCSTCLYDQAMQAKVAQHKENLVIAPVEAPSDKFTETWVDKMMQLPASKRKCRYMITGEVQRKICPNAYECGACAFDQMMQDRLQAESLPVQNRSHVQGFEVAEDFYYHEGHAWARPEYGGRVRVGLDDFARRLMGKKAHVELPAIGQETKQGEAAFRIRKNGEMVMGLSPLDGVVAHVNDRLVEHPELVLEFPYEKGWLFIVEPSKLRKNLKGLYFGEEAHQFLSQEGEKLLAMAHADMKIAADGGLSVEDIFADMENQNWTELVRAFLRS